MLVGLGMLWLPIVVSTVLVLVASNLIWMVLNFHKNDWVKLPDEEALAKALNDQGAQPGEYSFPHACGAADWKSDAWKEKFKRGPVGSLILQPPGQMNMGKTMMCWIVYIVVIEVFVAYLAGTTLAAGTEYLKVFQVAGTAAILGFAGAVAPSSIWMGRRWGNSFRMMIDGIVYGLLSAGAFGWLWPAAAVS